MLNIAQLGLINLYSGDSEALQLATAFQQRVEANGGTFESQQCLVDRIQNLKTLGFWDKASAIWLPHGVKINKFYAVKGGAVADFAFTRASTTTRVNSSNAVVDVATGVPVLDYTNEICPFLSLNPQRTNLFFPTDPLPTQNVTVAASPHTVSFYGTGTITFSGVHTGSLVGIGANDRVQVTFTPTAGTLTCTVTGTVIKGQIEAGQYASRYIPTTTATVTRVADAVTALTGVSSLIGQTEGTMCVEFKSNADSVAKAIFVINDNNNNNRVEIYHDATNKITAVISTGGVIQALIVSSTPFVSNTLYKCAVTYQGNKAALTINGTKIGEDLTVTVPACNQIAFSEPSGTVPFVGMLEKAAISKTAITDAEAIALTT